jgi:succinate dehydrogenase / fumarate reductase, cytochrome b subunit
MSDALKYAYYTGCVPKQSTRELDVSTRLVCARLDIELAEMTGAPCCGAGDVDQIKPRLNAAVNAVTLAQAERDGLDILTICNVCTLNLRAVNELFAEDPTELARANEALAAGGYHYSGGTAVTHLMAVLVNEVGRDAVAAKVTRALRGVRIAPFYGCQLLRPSETTGNRAPDDPRGLETLIEACGASPVDYDGRLDCCGWPVIVARERTAITASGAILAAAQAAGADAVVTPCPLCHISLDGYQRAATDARGAPGLKLPILHLSQLLGLALGFSPLELRLNRHVVSTRGLLARLGLALT